MVVPLTSVLSSGENDDKTYRIALYFGGAQLSRIGHLEAFHKTTFTRLVNGKEISFKSKSLVDLS